MYIFCPYTHMYIIYIYVYIYVHIHIYYICTHIDVLIYINYVHVYLYYIYTYIHIYIYPPDPINGLCSLICKQSWWMYFTYRLVKIFSENLSLGSDPPRKIMRYLFYFSTLLSCWFPPDQYDQAEIFVSVKYQLPKGKSARLVLIYFHPMKIWIFLRDS